ncbi:hybrid sensor histidine kinase/response regulator [Mesorhizobium loti]|nr:response regulator [Mesorhizobium loti]PLP59850.1 hybrid sensor histidine kinase/response regulator [Mesorhizobium loti]
MAGETIGADLSPAANGYDAVSLASADETLSWETLHALIEADSGWLWETDADLRFSWLSESYRAVTGNEPATVIGHFRFDFLDQVQKGSENATAHLENLQARRPFKDFVYQPKDSASGFRWVSTSGFPKFDTGGRFTGYRGIARNVTAMIEAMEDAKALSIQNAQPREAHVDHMMAALNAMSDAVCYYDAEDRLVLYNHALPVMYHGIADVIHKGITFRDIIDVGLERDFWDTETQSRDEWRDAVLGKRRNAQSSTILRFADGRIIMHREMHGAEGGTISICTDVTEFEASRSEAAAAGERGRELQSDLQRTIDSMTMGVIILDAAMNAEIINRAFYEIWKVTPEQVSVGCPFRALMDVNRYNGVYDIADEHWEDYVASRVTEIKAGDVAPREFQRADGRTMIYSVTKLSGGKRLISYVDVSEVKKREAEAEEARRYLENVLESLPAGVLIYDRDDHFVFANKKLLDSLPVLQPAWQAGKTFRDSLELGHANGCFRLSGDPAIDELYGVDPEAWLAAMLVRCRQRYSSFERQNPDGHWYQAFDMRAEDGTFIGVRVDISELKDRERALQESMSENEVFRSLIDNVPVSIYAKRSDLRLFYVNEGWCELTGVAREDAIDRTDVEIFGEEGQVFVEGDLAVLRTGKTYEVEEEITAADGSTRHQFARKSAMIASDGSLYLIGSTTDITDLKEREAELKEARQRAVLADRAKSEFLANMSHEIRTPMNGVLGMAELLAKSDLDAKQKTFTDIIVKSGNALLTIINDILDFSKIDAGQLVLDPAPFNLAEAIEDVATLVSTRAKEKDLELIVRVQPGLDGMFVGDVGRIRQIVTNLLGNAVKFTDEGHVLVDVTGQQMPSGTKLTIAVTDTGIGIPQAKLAQVFEKFSQVDTSSTRRHEGTGLGLAITSRLVELMDGEIGVDSAEGKGSTFWFTVTLTSAERTEVQRILPIDVTGARVLVVDDNAVNRSILSEQMTSWSFDSCAAASGPEGLKVLAAAAAYGVPVDCVVLDYQMPEMTGAEVARVIRNTEGLSSTPIIMLTSVDQTLSNANYRDLGIAAHLIKPARSSILLEALVSTIQKHRGGVPPHTLTTTDILNVQAPVLRTAKVDVRIAPVPSQPQVTSGDGALDILVAEDNEVNQLVFTQILADTGYSFEIVGNGRLALEASGRLKPRMILMDVSMPEMNGLEATGEIRKREADDGTHVPIVGVTAHALKGDRERCLEAGMDDYLPKPISPKALLEKLDRWLGGKTGAYRNAG